MVTFTASNCSTWIAAAIKNGQDQGLVRVNDLKALELLTRKLVVGTWW